MFSQNQKIVALVFVILFILLLVGAYWKDRKVHKVHYKKTYLILLIIGVVIALFSAITLYL